MSRSKIEWADRVWNPVRGCTRMTEGGPRWTGAVEFLPHKLGEPLRWRKPARVCVNSMSDLFHEALTDEEIAAVFGVMAACPHLTFQVLTKRPERMREWTDWALNRCAYTYGAFTHEYLLGPYDEPETPWRRAHAALVERAGPHESGELPNVWLGVSVEDQATADARIPLLLQCPAAVRFVSYEPALGPVDFARIDYTWQLREALREFASSLGRDADEAVATYVDGSAFLDVLYGRWFDGEDAGTDGKRLDWIIVGGESGPGARPFDVEWMRSTVQQCREAGVPVFVKQLGSMPREEGCEPGHVWTGSNPASLTRLRHPKGGDPSEWPVDLRWRTFPG